MSDGILMESFLLEQRGNKLGLTHDEMMTAKLRSTMKAKMI